MTTAAHDLQSDWRELCSEGLRRPGVAEAMDAYAHAERYVAAMPPAESSVVSYATGANARPSSELDVLLEYADLDDGRLVEIFDFVAREFEGTAHGLCARGAGGDEPASFRFSVTGGKRRAVTMVEDAIRRRFAISPVRVTIFVPNAKEA